MSKYLVVKHNQVLNKYISYINNLLIKLKKIKLIEISLKLDLLVNHCSTDALANFES